MGIVTDGLVGYWHYQQGVSGSTWENIAPDTKGQYNGTINGAVLQSDGMYFDGVDDYVSINSIPILEGFTVEVVFVYTKDDIYTNHGIIQTSSGIENILVLDYRFNTLDVRHNSQTVTLEKDIIFKNDINHLAVHRNAPPNSWTSSTTNMIVNSNNVYNSTKSLSFGGDITIGRVANYYLEGRLHSFRIYNRGLTQDELERNNSVGTSIGLTEEPPASNPPAVTIVNINAPTADNTLSDEPNMDRATITFKFDQDVTEWRVRTIGTDPETGILADSGGAVSAGTEITAEVDWTELYGEGQNRVNIYGKNADGLWTPYG